ncbi:bifunctional DNA primase/polymerase [Meiothermus rufus]|uniref:bifunctional DNA primase/polymerase n=1 Tax=Meiothermus rufus TaxID=604332 RepID=UPI00047F93CB|nr:bifunctional DNA primase/polymerase [Meiothermus rufus]
MTNLEAALHFAAMGYPVLPIAPESKRPIAYLAPRGLHTASLNPHVISAWYRLEPSANVAIVPPVGVVALDFDEVGEFSRFLRRWPVLEKAPHSRTPRGGAHVYLRVPEGAALRNHSGRALPGFEIKSSKNYLLEYPSRTERGSYQWIVPLRAPSDLPEMPRDLLAALQVPVLGAATGTPSREALMDALRLEALRVRSAAVGNRHNQLVRSAARVGGLVAQGLDREHCYNTLLRAALSVGLPEDEAASAILWGLERGKDTPALVRELPPRLRLWINRRERLGVRREC